MTLTVAVTCPHCGAGVELLPTVAAETNCRRMQRLACTDPACAAEVVLRMELATVTPPRPPRNERARAYRARRKELEVVA